MRTCFGVFPSFLIIITHEKKRKPVINSKIYLNGCCKMQIFNFYSVLSITVPQLFLLLKIIITSRRPVATVEATEAVASVRIS
jgi:hypothetical protein